MRFIVWPLLSLLVFSSAFAQNVRRLEEEAELEKIRQQKVEEIIKQRQEEEERLKKEPITMEIMEQRNLVEVEPNNILPADLSSIYALVPYSVRRGRFGFEVGVSYSLYEPSDYVSSFAGASLETFETLYGSAQLPLVELYFNTKYNFVLGSIGIDIGYGMYKNDVAIDDYGSDITLNLQIIRAGGKFILDNLFFEPFVAPYVGGGVYTVLFKESASANSFNGNTQLAPYIMGGALFQLNWIDKTAAVESYTEAGIENTFLFAEVRQYMPSSAEEDPDFSTNPTLSIGLSLEF